MSDLASVWHKGRLVTVSTAWWWSYTTISYDELYCLHGVKLTEKCIKCQNEEEDSA